MMRKLLSVAIAASFGLLPSQSQAVPVAYSVQGHVTSMDAALTPFFSVGDLFTASGTVESSHLPDTVTPTRADYYGTSSMGTMSIDGVSGGGLATVVRVGNDDGGVDYFNIASNGGTGFGNPIGPIGSSGYQYYYGREYYFTLYDSTGTAFSTTNLPTDLSLQNFDSGIFRIVYENMAGVQLTVYGVLDFGTTQPVVPEPATLGLGALGFALFAARRRAIRRPSQV